MIIEDEVRAQYNRYPYPSFSWFAKVKPQDVCHASFEVGSSLVHHNFEGHENKKIALLGCGTFEPYVQATLHSKAIIDAIDISTKSLTLARRRCSLRRVKNVNFIESDVSSFCRSRKETYDFISCYGVLHHLPDPGEGFKALASALKPEGFARIMVYSKTQRRKPLLLRQALKSLGVTPESFLATVKIKSLLRCLPLSHPLKLSQFANTELHSRAGAIDSLLHTCESAFDIKNLIATLAEAGLTIQAWDFSENLLKLLSDAPGSSLEDQIDFLESFDQWPGPFVFWASKMTLKKGGELVYRTNPHLHGSRPARLTNYESETLAIASDKSIPFEEGFSNLIRRRYLLEVKA